MKKCFTILGGSAAFLFGLIFLTSIKAFGPPEAGRIGLRDLAFIGVLTLVGAAIGQLAGFIVGLVMRTARHIFQRRSNTPQ